jgi:hypothetical protein
LRNTIFEGERLAPILRTADSINPRLKKVTKLPELLEIQLSIHNEFYGKFVCTSLKYGMGGNSLQ